jgi:hypothetical protein
MAGGLEFVYGVCSARQFGYGHPYLTTDRAVNHRKERQIDYGRQVSEVRA